MATRRQKRAALWGLLTGRKSMGKKRLRKRKRPTVAGKMKAARRKAGWW